MFAKNPKLHYALKQELYHNFCNTRKIVASDCQNFPMYNPPSGKYTIIVSRHTVIIHLDKDYVYIYSFTASITQLKDYLNNIYNKYSSSANCVLFFLADGDRWGIPIFRNPRIIQNPNIKNVLDNVTTFVTSKNLYNKNGYAYRKGYLLHGPPGSGKSLTIEAVAATHNMSVYMVNLNAEHMTDATLINLISRVPSNSIIVFEEIDEQLKTLRESKSINLSFGGLLSAIDGPQRLNEGCLIIMTTNNIDFFTAGEKTALFRKGRIDSIINFPLTERATPD